MSGALAERVFVEKLEKVGFREVDIVEHHRFGIEDAAAYPLFTPDLIGLMERLLDSDRRAEVATGITVRAMKL